MEEQNVELEAQIESEEIAEETKAEELIDDNNNKKKTKKQKLTRKEKKELKRQKKRAKIAKPFPLFAKKSPIPLSSLFFSPCSPFSFLPVLLLLPPFSPFLSFSCPQ